MTEKPKKKPTLTQRVEALEKSRKEWERVARGALIKSIEDLLDKERARVRDDAMHGEIARAFRELERILIEELGGERDALPLLIPPPPSAGFEPYPSRWRRLVQVLREVVGRRRAPA